MYKFSLITLLFVLSSFQTSQSTSERIRLRNGSFEGQAQDATVPTGWEACSMGSTPDILPGHWGVYLEAAHGETYMGLITREDGSWEEVGQPLSSPMLATECYAFSIDLAHSKTYAGYNKPLKLRIWGGSSSCRKDQLLVETPVINHTEWKTYDFMFTPKKEYNYIILEAYFATGKFYYYRGNILLDACTPFDMCVRASAL